MGANPEDPFRSSPLSCGVPLPDDLEHGIHEFLRIAEVCRLRAVSCAWRAHIRAALEERYLWDVVHCARGGDLDAHLWLSRLADARVNVRSLELVCFSRSEFFVNNLKRFLSSIRARS